MTICILNLSSEFWDLVLALGYNDLPTVGIQEKLLNKQGAVSEINSVSVKANNW